jgi:hypothetical protein
MVNDTSSSGSLRSGSVDRDRQLNKPLGNLARMQTKHMVKTIVVTLVTIAAAISFLAVSPKSSAQQFAVWLDGQPAAADDAILTSLDHAFGPGHWAVVSTADLETPGFLDSFDTLIMSRSGASFGTTSISAMAQANITAYVGSGLSQGNIVLFTNDAKDNFFGTPVGDPFDPNVDQLFVNAANFASASHHGFIGEFNGTVIALNSLHLLAGSAGALRYYGPAFTYGMGPVGAASPINAGLKFPFTDLDASTYLTDVSGANPNDVVTIFTSEGVAGEPAVLVNHRFIYLESEGLNVYALYGATHSTITDAKLSGGAGTQLNATGTGQYIIYTVPIPLPGTYSVKVGVRTRAKSGKFQLSIADINQGQAQDEYTSTVGYSVRDLGTVTLFDGGDTVFKFLVTGKNANSGGYSLAFDYIELIPTNRQETESLKVQSKTSAPAGIFQAPAASGGAGTFFNATGVGNYITYTVPVATAGTYHLRVGIQTRPNKGIFQLAINGLNIGQPQDEYYPSLTYGVRDLGMVSFSVDGNYAFRFTVTGKNASSSGYTLAFDYIELIPE